MFSIHGEWKIEVNNNVLVQTFSGSWNEEAVLAYIREFREKALPLTKGNWAILSIFEYWELGIPDIEKHVVEHCQWFIDNGCRRDCHVYSVSEAKKMQLDKMIPLNDRLYQRMVFTDIDTAIHWLESSNFNVSNSSFIQKLRHQLNVDN